MSKKDGRWPKGCQAAVSLSYDDGLPNHYQLVTPQLEARGMRGTFYVPLKSDVMQNPIAWREMAKKGHELGNHTVFHPCWSIQKRHASWLPEEFNTEHYTPERWLDEVRTANQALTLVDGRKERTYGNTCFDNYLGPEDNAVCLEPLIARVFRAARGENTMRPVELDPVNFNNLGTVWGDRRSFGDFALDLERILDTHGWVIYTFHGVGPGAHDLFVDLSEHTRLLDFLKENRERIWTAPVIDVVNHLKKLA
jgi:sialate O-acetylesterase